MAAIEYECAAIFCRLLEVVQVNEDLLVIFRTLAQIFGDLTAQPRSQGFRVWTRGETRKPWSGPVK